MYTIAHLSDPHLDGGERACARLEQVATYLRGLTAPPDVIVLTGDIIQGDAVAGYAVAHNLLAEIAPVFPCPGNSDKRQPLREALLGDIGAGEGDEPVNYWRTAGAVTFIMLDSSVPGEFSGALAAGTLRWLERTLADIPETTPVVIGLHHPPIALGNPAIDALGLRNPEELAAVLRSHPNIMATLVGHTHGATVTTFAGSPLIVAPGIHSGLRLWWEGAEGMLDESVPPGIAIHLVNVRQQRFVTHLRAIS